MCISVFACYGYTWIWVHVLESARTWKPEVDAGCILSWSTKVGPPIEPGACPACPEDPALF